MIADGPGRLVVYLLSTCLYTPGGYSTYISCLANIGILDVGIFDAVIISILCSFLNEYPSLLLCMSLCLIL